MIKILIFTFTLTLFLFQTTFSQEVKTKKPYKGNYLILGIGTGASYGGNLGFKAQARFGGNQGVGIHAGYGYLQDGYDGKSVGLKVFPYRNLYVNVQYGTIGVFNVQSSGPQKVGANTIEEKAYFAWSYLIGGDWIWGRGKIRHGFNAALGVGFHKYEYDYQSDNKIQTPVVDLGYIICF